ncbi:MAG: hypothetical protein WC343_12325, partial [Bacilli bacterium]
MKKMLSVVIILLIWYIVIQIVYSYMVGSQVNSYKLMVDNKVYEIKETFNYKHKSSGNTDKPNYYYEIKRDDKLLFSFKIIGNYTGIEKFMNNMFIYETDTKICVYPIFKGQTDDIDVICNSNGNHYLYGAIKGQDPLLDAFVTSLKVAGYNHPSWNSTNLVSENVGAFDIYTNNISDNQNIVIWQTAGFYRVTPRGGKLFSLKVRSEYNETLTASIDQYYIVPDYKESTGFSRLYITNLISGT